MGEIEAAIHGLLYRDSVHFHQQVTRLDIHALSVGGATGDNALYLIRIVVTEEDACLHGGGGIGYVLVVAKGIETLVRGVQLAHHVVQQVRRSALLLTKGRNVL